MEPVTSRALKIFFKALGERIPGHAAIYLLGGSALCLLGNTRETLDVDYSLESSTKDIETIIQALARELKMDLEAVPLAEFIPLPPDAPSRRHFIGQFGQLDVYIFDLYSIALSKIARGFESDLEDVQFLLSKNLITWDELETYFKRSFQAFFLAPEKQILTRRNFRPTLMS